MEHMWTSMCAHNSWCTGLPTEQFTRAHRHASISLCALECMGMKLNDRNSKWLTYQLHGPSTSARKAACGVCRRPNPMGEIQSQWYRTAFLKQPHIPLKSSVLQTLCPVRPPRRSQSLLRTQRTVLSLPSPRCSKHFIKYPLWDPVFCPAGK